MSSMRLAMYWILRLSLGAVIAAAGIAKLASLPGFVAVIHTYQLSLSDSVAWAVAISVALFELCLGIWMLSGRATPKAASLSILMHAGYALLLTVTLVRGIHLENCGCFGTFLARPLQWYTPIEDVILMAVSYVLMVLAHRRAALR